MLKEERHKLIMREVNLHNKVLSADLSRLLDVSEDTIRRDFKELIDAGKILKVHGGAVSPSFHFPHNMQSDVYAREAKQVIAEKTKKLLKKDSTVLIEGGTTIIELAKAISNDLRATFFVLSPQVAIALSDREKLEVISIGGKLSKNANVHTGASVINQLADIKTDLCIIGANGLSVTDGLTDSDWEIVQIIKAMMRSSQKVAVLSISEKLNTTQRLKVCDLQAIDYLITELPPDDAFLAQYKGSVELL
ncbi:DeoR/GlpR transcriptional regulator [Chitinophaga lutea]|uniref:DeoR/GlpR transcriptional regulator n=1 Tax=Chitinophaga lutea TaxID=2488634 RepID=A0A3N4PY05_9BACT|nr:DeoR/GlpR family DNA-binding transcription regulator [Chitinophaga lutea]RPE12796.1 DeoR/GlpR transcriptional regulator [Chitinophaga lutea]